MEVKHSTALSFTDQHEGLGYGEVAKSRVEVIVQGLIYRLGQHFFLENSSKHKVSQNPLKFAFTVLLLPHLTTKSGNARTLLLFNARSTQILGQGFGSDCHCQRYYHASVSTKGQQIKCSAVNS